MQAVGLHKIENFSTYFDLRFQVIVAPPLNGFTGMFAYGNITLCAYLV